MALDREMFADKLKRYCEQLQISPQELSEQTGISPERVMALENQTAEPTGDEILILADLFKCDFKFFISNEKLASFKQTESLYRKHGDQLTKQDRWAIQEFLFLCECEEFLQNELNLPRTPFSFHKQGTFFKDHGRKAAAALRKNLGYQKNEVPRNIYEDFTKIGCHVFRREIQESTISGICIRHPVAGPCLLINYNEDLYRQRFSAAHEAAHAILDEEDDFVVSFKTWDKKDLVEIRANTFASNYLLPPEFLCSIPNANAWSLEMIREWANKLMVNTQPLLYALKDCKLITESQASSFLQAGIKVENKSDPEISSSLSPKGQLRKQDLLKRGLSDRYAGLCFDAHSQGLVSSGRLAEMLLMPEAELPEIAALFGRRIQYAD